MRIFEWLFVAVLAGVGLGVWGNWVRHNDEHVTQIMECLHRHHLSGHEEAVIACEQELR